MSVKKSLKDVKSLRELMREPFKHYGKKVLYKEEFFQYFREKGWKEKDIEDLWVMGIARSGIVQWGMIPEIVEFPSKVEAKTAIRLLE